MSKNDFAVNQRLSIVVLEDSIILLPTGFVLIKEKHFIRLFFGNNLVDVFPTANLDSSKITKRAYDFMKNGGNSDDRVGCA